MAERWQYLPAAGVYLSPSGKRIAARDVARGLQSVMTAVEADLADEARELAGKDAPAAWRQQVLQRLLALHLAAAAAAQGGFGAMDREDYDRVDVLVQHQATYLDGFADDLPRLSPLAAAARAALYAGAAWATLQGTRQAVQHPDSEAQRVCLDDAASCDDCVSAAEDGWLPIDEVLPIGDTPCGANCRCHIEYRRGAEEAEAA